MKATIEMFFLYINPGLVKDETSQTKINLWYFEPNADGFQPVYQTQHK